MAVAQEVSAPRKLIERSFGAPRGWRTKGLLVALDLMVVFLGWFVAGWFAPPGPDANVSLGLMLGAWWFFLAQGRLYSARFITRRSDEVRRVSQAAVLALASVAVMAFLFRLEIGRQWLTLSGGLGFIGVSVEREIIRQRYSRLRRTGAIRRKVLMVGRNEESDELTAMFKNEQSLGYEVVASIDPLKFREDNQLTTEVLSRAREFDAASVMIATTSIDTSASNRLLRDLIESGLHVELSSTLNDIDPGRLTVRPLGRYPVVYVEPVRRNGWRVAAKRTFDLVLALVGIIALAPVGLLLAASVKFTSSGPVIFRQTRVGQNGNPFELLKFRTMVENAEEIQAELAPESLEENGPLFKMKDDPRITSVGRFLRKSSLDELPQLWNVVMGQMSLVGPRPALYEEMKGWDTDLYGRLRVRPGITGMWQVSGRSSASFEEYTRLDLYYVDNWSLVIDVIILVRTVPAVLKRDGAY